MNSRSRSPRTGARLPLMAGNWKMYENHLEAIALVQKLAFTLTGRDFDSVEVAVLRCTAARRTIAQTAAGARCSAAQRST